ncbi:MAG: zinc-ribbon domain-containing protein [Eubacterium sp.]|nr:zinc-ribbon domain-containing protein [Eubacterium sp.]
MAFCPNCGKEIPDDSVFCTECGSKLEDYVKAPEQEAEQVQGEGTTEEPVQEEPVQAQAPVNPATAVQKLKQPLSKKTMLMIGGIVVIAVIVVIAAVLINKAKHTINLEDYVEVTVEGADGYGTATVTFSDDLETKINEVGKEPKGSDNELAQLAELFGESVTIYEYLCEEEAFSYEADVTDSLSNEDEVTVTFDYDNEIAKEYGITFKGDSYTYTVEGLEEIKEIDPFENVTVEFSGIDGDVSAEIKDPDESDMFSYYIDGNDYDLSIGDSVTVKVYEDAETIASQGYQMSATSKEYTVESADTYLSSLSQLDDNTLNSMKKQAEDVLKSDGEDDDDFKYGSWSYKGAYLLVAKDSDTWSNHNEVYLIYTSTITAKDSSDEFGTKKMFVPVEFSNILVKADGTVEVDLTGADLVNNGFYSWGADYDYGFSSQKKLYEEVIKDSLANYTYEISDGLKDYK